MYFIIGLMILVWGGIISIGAGVWGLLLAIKEKPPVYFAIATGIIIIGACMSAVGALIISLQF